MKARSILLALVAATSLATATWWVRRDVPINPLTIGPAGDVVVIDPSKPFALDPPPAGWRHRTFWFTPPMQLAFVTKEGLAALRCETKAGGSIYGRHTDLDLTRSSVLRWRWFIEVPIASSRDEAARDGDDHPVRLFLEFRDSVGGRHAAEIIWANRAFKAGDWKTIGTFPHLVTDGGDANIGSWRDQHADLLAIYRTISKRTDAPRLTFLGIFCDTDNTGGRSVAYTSAVRLGER